ncbi:MAG: hypothetical protein H6747_07090 [Deltaproteobacteria bacterium]|nr:hypothetical protein [Deltaproteobacteria bacterium]
MPGPQPMQLKQLVKAAFKAHAIALPTDWKQPSGDPDGKQYVDAFKMGEHAVPFSPTMLFIPATPNKFHVDAAKKSHNEFEAYIDGICDAICNAWNIWRAQAKFQNLKVMAVSAIGAPGCLKGPKLENLIMMTAPKSKPAELDYSKAIAKHLSKAWAQWQDGVAVPGLPWYPAFAAFPGPQAPPMPNIPTPLIACPSTGMAEMTPAKLKKGMCDALGDSGAMHHKELFDSVAKGVAAVFIQWLGTQQVMNVLGKGPIPTFAPPFVPVGPVVAGDNIAVPGHLAV